jgi:hypothetical protein
LTASQVQLGKTAWTFYPTPAGFAASFGTDPAGAETPCSQCSVSKVVSIGQAVSTWTDDGSYFGIDANDDNAITWNQVLFGDWQSNCAPGSSLCSIQVSSNPFTYYGGPQYYPDDYISESDMAPAGYGPYETYDGIDTTSDEDSGSAKLRAPAGTFTEPLPPTQTPVPAPTVSIKPMPPCYNAVRQPGVHFAPSIICPQ